MAVKGASESFPFFDKTILVFKVMGKMFAYVGIEPRDGVFCVSMKCDPEKALDLRERYEGISRGQHTRNLGWISVEIESGLPDSLVSELILHSVDEVIKKLPKKKRDEYGNLP